MSVDSKQVIKLADWQALADLANAKLSPSTPYAFSAFVDTDKIGMPVQATTTAIYGGVGQFLDGSKVTLRLYAYKTIAGVKTYSSSYLLKAAMGTAGASKFSMKWDWISVVGTKAPDGYIIVIPILQNPPDGWQYFWLDIGNVQTITVDGSFSGWNVDFSLDANISGPGVLSLPCRRSQWLKMFNTIHKDLCAKFDIFGGGTPFTDAHKISGPWCISVAPKCYLKLNGFAVYKNLAFIYSESDPITGGGVSTGNQISPEADIFDFWTPVNGANNLNYSVNGTVNGRLIVFSTPANQNPGDWTVSTTPSSGVVYTFNPSYQHPVTGNQVTAFIFDFTDVPYAVGTPIILSITPTAGGSVMASSNGAISNVVFTGPAVTYTTTDTSVIHYAGKAAKSAALPNTLSTISFTGPSTTGNYEAHYRVFINGVFTANTLPTLGLMGFLDQDLPQYNPQQNPNPTSSRRIPISDTLPAIPAIANKIAIYPVFRDKDFTPDSVFGGPLNGSTAWQVLGAKSVTASSSTDNIIPFEPSESLTNVGAIFVPSDATDIRFLAQNLNVSVYAKANDFPTLTDFDASGPGNAWLSVAASLPGFAKDTTWFYAIYNPTSGTLEVTTTAVIVEGSAPNGTFFPTIKDDNGKDVPQTEGYSYFFPGTETVPPNRPIPQSGYSVFSITFRRLPITNNNGVAGPPGITTADLPVKIGVMKGFGWATAGTFDEIETTTIPAGLPSVTVTGLLPVLSGTFLAYQCDEQLNVRALVNFQPMMHSTFSQVSTKVAGADYAVGYYNGAPWYDPIRKLLFFVGGFLTQPIVLPLTANVYNETEALLNLL